MKKNIRGDDKISKQTLHEILLDIKYRLDHLEDIEADNRALIVKVIKQGNSIVKFLAKIDIEPVEDVQFEDMQLPSLNKKDEDREGRIKSLKELLDEFMERKEGLKELEDELEKYRDEITPGQIGES